MLAIRPTTNRPGTNPATGKPWADVTGAFAPEARAWAALHGGKVATFDNTRGDAARFRDVCDLLDGRSGLRAVAFFCHGYRSGLQCGATVRNVEAFSWALRAALAPGAPVILYACDAARDLDNDRADDLAKGPAGDGGFASLLSRHLGADHWVDAHVTTAHTTINPHVRRFRGGGAGAWIVEPGSPEWAAWRARLKGDRDFRLSFSLTDPVAF